MLRLGIILRSNVIHEDFHRSTCSPWMPGNGKTFQCLAKGFVLDRVLHWHYFQWYYIIHFNSLSSFMNMPVVAWRGRIQEGRTEEHFGILLQVLLFHLISAYSDLLGYESMCSNAFDIHVLNFISNRVLGSWASLYTLCVCDYLTQSSSETPNVN